MCIRDSLGVGHAVEQRGVALLGVHVHEVDVKLLGENLLHLLGFALAEPVSYTHLDVYKRQSRDRAMRISSAVGRAFCSRPTAHGAAVITA